MRDLPPALHSARTLCLAGLLGGLSMAVGDLLLLGVPMSGLEAAGAGVAILGEVSPVRLATGGALGPVAGCMYVVGGAFAWRLISPEAPRLRAVAALGTSGVGVLAGAFHASCGMLGLLHQARPALEAAGRGDLWGHALVLSGLLLAAAVLVGVPAGLAVAVAVATGRTPLPRAAALLTPLGTILLLSGLGLLLPSPVGGPLLGAAYNLALALSFGLALPTARRLDAAAAAR